MAKRIAQSSVNWTAIAERVHPAQKPSFNSFKAKSDSYLRRVLANPAEPPKINWAQYKAAVPIPGMVDTFQKQYEALKVPFPADNVTSKVEAQASQVKVEIATFISESNTRIAEYQAQLAGINQQLPYGEMTMEDYRDSFPESAIDPINRPTLWPHQAEDQPDFVDDEKPTAAH